MNDANCNLMDPVVCYGWGSKDDGFALWLCGVCRMVYDNSAATNYYCIMLLQFNQLNRAGIDKINIITRCVLLIR